MLTPDSLAQLCRSRLQCFAEAAPGLALALPFDQAVAELLTIVQTNLQPRGKIPSRFERWKKSQAPARSSSLSDYVDQVIRCWTADRAQVQRLSAGDERAWLRLYDELRAKAAHLLANYRPDLATHSADDFAQQACIQIHRTRFSFDVPFAAWAATILANVIKKELDRQKHHGGPALSLDRPAAPRDEQTPLELGEQIDDERAGEGFEQVENRELLLLAIKRLAVQRQEVIVMTFWEYLDDSEIAARLDTTIENVWVLRHRALADLRKTLEQDQGTARAAQKKRPTGATRASAPT